jgi:hypothetical protein
MDSNTTSIAGNTEVVETPPQSEDIEERLKDPRKLMIDEIDENKKNEKVSQYMMDMYDINELFTFDK